MPTSSNTKRDQERLERLTRPSPASVLPDDPNFNDEPLFDEPQTEEPEYSRTTQTGGSSSRYPKPSTNTHPQQGLNPWQRHERALERERGYPNYASRTADAIERATDLANHPALRPDSYATHYQSGAVLDRPGYSLARKQAQEQAEERRNQERKEEIYRNNERRFEKNPNARYIFAPHTGEPFLMTTPEDDEENSPGDGSPGSR